MLLFIAKEEELASYAVKINDIIKNEIINEINQETTVKCSDLRQNGYDSRSSM